MQDMDLDLCLRYFLYNWTGVMMMKLIITNLAQLFGFLWKLFKDKCLKKEIKIAIDV